MLRKFYPDDSGNSDQSFFSRIRKKPFTTLVIILCLVNITLVVINVGIWFMAARQKLFIAADFTSFYTAFRMVRIGEGEQLYNADLQSAYQQELMGGVSFEGGVLRFANPPYVAILLSPLTLLPLETAFSVWSIIQIGLLVWLIIWMNQVFENWQKIEKIALLISLLAFWPLMNSFLLGQFSIFLLLCCGQMYINMRNSKQARSGFWLALMTIKPQSIFIPVMMTLNRRYYRTALYAIITGFCLVFLSILVIGLSPWWDYIHTLQVMGSFYDKFGVNPSIEYTFRGILTNIFGNIQGNLINTISIFFLFLGMAFVWFLWSKDIQQQSSRFKLYFAFTFSLSVLLSLHLNPHDSLILVFPAALFYDYLREKDYPRKAYTLFVLLCPLIFFFTAFGSDKLFGGIRPAVITIVVMLIWMGKYLIDESRSTPKSQELLSAPFQ